MLSVLVLSALVTTADVGAIIETAQRYVGKSYVYGDEGAQGFDCSGFVQRVFKDNGAILPRTSRDQAMVGSRVDWTRVRAGDLLFFTDRPGGKRVTHVGIAMDDGRMIHASTGRREIVIDKLDMDYYLKRRLFARRIIGKVDDAPLQVTQSTPEPAPKQAVVKKTTSKKKNATAKSRKKSQQKSGKTKRV